MNRSRSSTPSTWLRWIALLMLCLAFVATSKATAAEGTVAWRKLDATGKPFTTLEIWVDSHQVPLAAYQITLRPRKGRALLVGVEGGEEGAFSEPPHYDPKALQRDRVIIAAFSLLPASKLPSGPVRVARLHLQQQGTVATEYEAILTTAGDAAGHPIAAKVFLR